jgi:hypothetical protein
MHVYMPYLYEHTRMIELVDLETNEVALCISLLTGIVAYC